MRLYKNPESCGTTPYQRVYCPNRKQMVHLTDPPPSEAGGDGAQVEDLTRLIGRAPQPATCDWSIPYN